MTTLEEVGEALVDQILKPVELRALDFVAEDANFPAAMLGPPTIDYENLDDGQLVYDQDIFLFVGAQVGRHQKKLYRWMAGPDSIHDRLQANRSLGFDDVDAHATEARPLNLQEYASYKSYGGAVSLHVIIG